MARIAVNPKTRANGALRRSAVVLALIGVFALIVSARLPFCPMAGVLGVPCPGCGLTRATLALLRGDVRAALRLHPLVLLILPIFVATVSNAAIGYVRGPRPGATVNAWASSRVASALAFGLLALTLGVWGARFFGYFGGPAPVETFRAWADAHFQPKAPSGSSAR